MRFPDGINARVWGARTTYDSYLNRHFNPPIASRLITNCEAIPLLHGRIDRYRQIPKIFPPLIPNKHSCSDSCVFIVHGYYNRKKTFTTKL